MMYRFAHKILAPLALCVLMVAGFSCWGQEKTIYLQRPYQINGDIIYQNFNDTTFQPPDYSNIIGEWDNNTAIDMDGDGRYDLKICEYAAGIHLFSHTISLAGWNGFEITFYKPEYGKVDVIEEYPKWCFSGPKTKTNVGGNGHHVVNDGIAEGLQYLGIRYRADSNSRYTYGWIRFSTPVFNEWVETPWTYVTLHDAAFCTDPDAHFRAGQRSKGSESPIVLMRYIEGKSIQIESLHSTIRRVSVVNLMGREMFTNEYEDFFFSVQINYDKLPRGWYLARVLTSDGRVESVKFLVQ